MSRGQFQQRTNSGRARKRYKAKGKANGVVIIDVDSIHENFIIIDPPESLQQKSPGSRISGKDKMPLYEDVIFIDDEESNDCSSPRNGFGVSGGQESNFSSRNISQPAFNQSLKSVEVDGEECQTVHRRKPSLKSPNCQVTNSWEKPSPEQHGFDFVSSSSSCEHDTSDCDIVEDFLGNIREQWEKASLRKKPSKTVPKGHYGSEDLNASGSNTNSESNVEVDNTVNHTAEALIPSSSSSTNDEKGNLASSMFTDKGIVADTYSKSKGESPNADLEQTVEQEVCHVASIRNTEDVNGVSLESTASAQPQGENTGGGPASVQNYIIGDREMLKKSDEYKHAAEVEWASRKKELKSQAEEAQRLRKRKKAETLRLLDMERRQKQRVEEMREAQKKDEETLNLKEDLRIEVRRELDKLEVKCRDMASLLRGLGIDVGGGLLPMRGEVLTAYKQALLKFHPDRASSSDVRSQVEAEEKFKLITRAKEKLLLTA